MENEWKQLTIGDVCYVTDGAHTKIERVDQGIMYLTSKNIGAGELKLDSFDFIQQSDFERLFADTEKSQRKLKTGDVLMGIIGTFGNCYVYKDTDKFGISSSVAILRANPEVILPEYLYFVISSNSFFQIVEKYKGGSVQGYTNIATIKALPISVPSLETQQKIVKQLIPLNLKISLNRQINQTLEQMAQTLFKSWFVDFDPVIDNALDAGNEIPDSLQERAEQRRLLRAKADFKPLPAETRALFPSEFEETELGWVPKGWEVESLDKIANFQNGLALQKFRPLNDIDDFLPVLKISDLRQGYTDGIEKARTDIIDSCRVYDGDMIFSWSGTLMIDIWTGGNAALNQHLYKVTSQKYPLSFYLYWTKHHLRRFQHIAAAKAVTMGHIKKGDLSDSMCLVPNQMVLKKYDNIASDYLKQAINLRLQNNQLSEMRDSLLPKLISGELALDDLPQDVAKAAEVL